MIYGRRHSGVEWIHCNNNVTAPALILDPTALCFSLPQWRATWKSAAATSFPRNCSLSLVISLHAVVYYMALKVYMVK